MKRFLILVVSCFWIGIIIGQEINLDACIQQALENNLDAKQQQLRVNIANVQLKQAKNNKLPDINGFLNHGVNQGRSIDPSTNGFINETIRYAGYGVSTNLTVFNGFKLQESIAQMQAWANAMNLDFEQSKNDIKLGVTLAYLQVLTNQEVLKMANQQANLSNNQVERLTILNNKGAIMPSDLSDLIGQYLNDKVSIQQAENALKLAKLHLTQWMNIPYNAEMQIADINLDEQLKDLPPNANEIYEQALKSYAGLQANSYKLEASKAAMQVAKAEVMPSIILSGNMNTNYSSAASNSAGKIGYGEQLGNNLYSSLNFGIRVPIFNQHMVKNNIKMAAIEYQNQQVEWDKTNWNIRRDIEEAWLHMRNALDLSNTYQKQVEAYELSFMAAEARFNNGVGSTVDYLLAKNNLDRSKLNSIVSKYAFELRKKMLLFYQGKSL